MCFFGSKPKPTVVQQQKPPEKVAEPTDIGSVRKAEDDALFGGVPDLRVDRSASDNGVAASGTGLKMM